MSALSELLNRRLPAGWTGQTVHLRAGQLGHVLSRPAAYEYLRGAHPLWPEEAELAAFAAVLDIPMAEIHRSLETTDSGEPFMLPRAAARLTGAQREVVRQVVRMLLASPPASSSTPGSGPRLIVTR